MLNSEETRRICPGCDRLLARTAEHFHRNKRRSDGFDCYCKQCKKEKGKRRRIANPPVRIVSELTNQEEARFWLCSFIGPAIKYVTPRNWYDRKKESVDSCIKESVLQAPYVLEKPQRPMP